MRFWLKGSGILTTLFLLAPVAGTTIANTSHATYTIDSTGGGPDYIIEHSHAGATSYVMPAQTVAGRCITLRDLTGAINTLANNVFLVPHGADTFNGSSGFSLTGTVTTNGTTTITGSGTKFQSELAPGMSIIISNQAGVNYLINTIASDTSLTLTAAFTGASTSGLTVKRTSLTFAANNGTLYIVGDGTNWTVKGDGTPTILTYTASSGGTVAPFIPPQGVTAIDTIRGCGGGGGGGGGQGNFTGISEGSPQTNIGGAGGGSAIMSTVSSLTVTPQTALAVTIGGGGVGGTGGAGGASPASGSDGGGGTPTTLGTLVQFLGGSGGKGGGIWNGTNAAPPGVGFTSGTPSSTSDTTKNQQDWAGLAVAAAQMIAAVQSGYQSGGFGLLGDVSGTNPSSLQGNMCPSSATATVPGGGGAAGTIGSGAAAGSGAGGGGGAAGPFGNGGNGGGGGGGAAGTTGGTGGAAGTGGNGGTAGGNGNTTQGGTAGAGGAGVANSGAGGGGGGGGGSSSGATNRTGGTGGAGGSGQLVITYVL